MRGRIVEVLDTPVARSNPVEAKDGVTDAIDCGAGVDILSRDPGIDKVTGCENLR